MNKVTNFVLDTNKFAVDSEFFSSEDVLDCTLPWISVEDDGGDDGCDEPVGSVALVKKKKKKKKIVKILRYGKLMVNVKLTHLSIPKIKKAFKKRKSEIKVRFLDGVDFDTYQIVYDVKFHQARFEKELKKNLHGSPMEYCLEFDILDCR